MDSVKYRKLLDYSIFLEKQGNQFEKEGDEVEAIPTYIKMVDVLLLLAEVAPDYPSWQRFTGKAEAYQKRMKILIAKALAKAKEPQVQKSAPNPVPVAAQPQIITK